MSWIWLPEKKYPQYKENYSNIGAVTEPEKGRFKYCAADFNKKYEFQNKIVKAELNVSADNMFMLFINGSFEGMGPALPGGDFLCRKPAPKHYANRYVLENINANELEIFSKVRLLPERICDYSRNFGGFMFDGTLYLDNGEKVKISTDNSWNCRRDAAYYDFCSFDSSFSEEKYTLAKEIKDVWHTEISPLPNLNFETISECEFFVEAGQEKVFNVELDKIWAARLCAESNGKCTVNIIACELKGQVTEEENLKFAAAGKYSSFCMHSIGYYTVKIKNEYTNEVRLKLCWVASYYPVEKTGEFVCSDADFNKVYDVCRHTLKICRQSIHLDSPKHQELLACTGDYNIDMLMTLYMFGDMRLAKFDLIRTADWLKKNCGRMFHTTYSLIFVKMLYDCFMFTGDIELLKDCEAGLEALFMRFESYFGESGVIEYPPDFMFVDWTVVDGYSMHHPPKALGQTVLNAFYYEALNSAAKIYEFLGKTEKCIDFVKKAEKFKISFNNEFFDVDKKLYFDGKNDAYGGFDYYSPANSSKRYYTKYPDILACSFGLTDTKTAVSILERIIFDDTMQDIQPYFMHYLFIALKKYGLFEKYGIKLLERWKSVVIECDKGLKEGWIAPQEDYSFDHSHSWGGTVGYVLPDMISGMKISEPGMKKLEFFPCLFGLEFAEIKIPVESGFINLSLHKGKKPIITAPDDIEFSVSEGIL